MTPEQIAALVAELRAADFMRPPTLATAWAAADLIERLQSEASEAALQYLSDAGQAAERIAALMADVEQLQQDRDESAAYAESAYRRGYYEGRNGA